MKEMFINFRAKMNPDITFNAELKRFAERTGKNYFTISIDNENRIVQFNFTDDKMGFPLESNSQWVKGILPHGLSSAKTRRIFLHLGIKHSRLFVERLDDNSVIYKY